MSLRHGLPFVLCATALCWAPAEARARSLALDFDGCDGAVDQAEVASLLQLELQADGSGNTVSLLRGATEGDTLVLRIACGGSSPDVTVTADGRPLTVLSFSDVPPHLRPRTLALALAERVRRVRLEAPPPRPPPLPAVAGALPPPVLEPAPLRPVETDRMRRAGTWAWALAIPTAVGFSVGSAIAAVGDANPRRGDLRGAGAAVLGTSCAPLIGSVVAFAIWMHEKRALDRQVAAFDRAAQAKNVNVEPQRPPITAGVSNESRGGKSP